MNKDYLVTKSNYFIMNSSYDLSLEEQKIILTLASMVQPTDEEFKPYKFRISEFMDLVGVIDKSKYTEIPKITKELMKKVFEIHEGNKLIQTAWLSGVVYEKGTGMVELTFSPYLKPYMLKLNSMFTQYKLANILNMKSKYSPRIYELLKCNEYKKQGYIEIEVDELRKLLRTDNIYPLYADFKRKVIMTTKNELKKLSDISFETEEIKTGRKVTSIKFFIKSNSSQLINTPKPETSLDELSADVEKKPLESLESVIKTIISITDNKLSPSEANAVWGDSDGNIDIIQKVYEYSKTQNIQTGLVGFMRKLVRPGAFSEPQKSFRKNEFNNFEPRKKSERYAYLEEQCLLGQASEEERQEFDTMRGII